MVLTWKQPKPFAKKQLKPSASAKLGSLFQAVRASTRQAVKALNAERLKLLLALHMRDPQIATQRHILRVLFLEICISSSGLKCLLTCGVEVAQDLGTEVVGGFNVQVNKAWWNLFVACPSYQLLSPVTVQQSFTGL